jgi:hypothetical protein
MKTFIYSLALLIGASLAACSGDKKDETPMPPHEETVSPAPTETVAADNKAEMDEYKAKVDAVLADIDAKIEQNKEMKKNEKDKNKKDSYDKTITYLEELKSELKDRKDHFDDKANNGWQEFKSDLDNLFNRHSSGENNTK